LAFQGFRVSEFQGFRVSEFQGFRVSGFQGFRVSGFQCQRERLSIHFSDKNEKIKKLFFRFY
jgi:hypothetical protein